MSVLEPAARAAMLDGGWPAVLALAGGAMRVALFRSGAEVSGNGYTRQTIDVAANAVNSDRGSTKDVETVTFSAVGGSIIYDQVRLYARNGQTLLITSDKAEPFTIAAGEPHAMTVQLQIPASAPIPCRSGRDIQTALTSDIDSKLGVELAGGLITTSDTIRVVDGDGGRITGQNASLTSSIQSIGSHLVRLASVVQYTGAKNANQAAIYYDRGSTLFENFALLGQNPADILAGTTGTRTPIGFHCGRAGGAYTGIGSGKATFRNFLIGGCDVGFDWGDDVADLNCDESQFYDVVAIGLRSMMRVNNLQGMGYKFTNLTIPGLVDNVFEMLAGGKLHVKNAFIGNPVTVLNFKKTLANSFSHNNAGYTLEGLDFDAQALGSRIVRMDAGQYYASIFVSRVDIGTNVSSPSLTYPMFQIADQTHLTIDSVRNLMPGSIAWNCSKTGPNANTSTVTIRNCVGWTSLSDVEQVFRLNESAGSVRVVVEGIKQYHTSTRLAAINDEVRTGAL